MEEFVSAVLSPAVVADVTILEDGNSKSISRAITIIMAIGKNGQNARLAARLTGDES